MPVRRLTVEQVATRMVVWLGHAMIWGFGCLIVGLASNGFVAAIVAAAWGLGLACHGYFAIVAPQLRQRLAAPARPPAPAGHSAEALAAAIAHEIRNPLTAARSLTQQIGDDPHDENTAEYARVATEELDRVERSIADLLRFARAPRIEPTTFDVADVVRSALATVSDRLAAITVEANLEARPAHGDPEATRQILINLFTNAANALSGAPAPRIDVTAGTDLAGASVWISVRDNGPGIAPDALEDVFRPFYTGSSGGTGLGLATSRRLAQAMSGDLEARPDVRNGAELVLTLPARAPA